MATCSLCGKAMNTRIVSLVGTPKRKVCVHFCAYCDKPQKHLEKTHLPPESTSNG